MTTITLDSNVTKLERASVPWEESGNHLVPTGVTVKMAGEGKYTYPEYTYPELHSRRRYAGSFMENVMELAKGRKWKVKVNTYGDDLPLGVVVAFTEVAADTEETPFIPFQDYELGRRSFFFGQPNFIQNPVFPRHNGKSAVLLCCLETGWGDSGNENVFVAFSEDGTPVGLYHEFSCC